MNLRDLDYLVAVAELKHFGKAALACHISQPTLSMQLKKLEDTLGVTLFERGGKQVIITPVGETIVQRARFIRREANEIREIARMAQDPLAGDFRLGAFPTLAPYFLPRAVPAIHKTLPKLKLLLVEEKTDALIAKINSGELDAALLALPIDDPALETLELFIDPFMLAVPKSHKLASRKRVSFHELQDESLLLLEEGHCLRAQALEVCRIAHVSERQEFRATSLETLRHMVMAGVGITLIPRLAMKKDDGIVYIPFAEKNVSRTVGLVWRKHTSKSEALARLCQIIALLF